MGLGTQLSIIKSMLAEGLNISDNKVVEDEVKEEPYLEDIPSSGVQEGSNTIHFMSAVGTNEERTILLSDTGFNPTDIINEFAREGYALVAVCMISYTVEEGFKLESSINLMDNLDPSSGSKGEGED